MSVSVGVVAIPLELSDGENDPNFDWIELTSGEWLKGEFRSMYDDTVDFDSDVLGLLEIDWEDVAAVYFQEPTGVRLGRRTVTATRLTVKDGLVSLSKDPADGSSAKVSEVIAIARDTRSEWDRWSIVGKVGLDFQRGNTDETRLTSTLNVERRSSSTRVLLSYLGNSSETSGITTTNSHRANGTFDYFFDDRIYLRPLGLEYFRDPFQNIGAQFTIGAGYGYRIFETGPTDWEILIGPAYRETRFSTVQAGESNRTGSGAGILQTVFETDLTEDLDLNLLYRLVLTNKRSGLLTQHFVGSLDYELTEILDLFIMLQFDRIEEPTTQEDGTTPEKDDVTLSVGFGLDL